MGGGGVEPISNFWCWVQICLKKKKKFCEKFSKFSGKNWNGFVLGFEYRVVRYTKYSEPQKMDLFETASI